MFIFIFNFKFKILNLLGYIVNNIVLEFNFNKKIINIYIYF